MSRRRSNVSIAAQSAGHSSELFIDEIAVSPGVDDPMAYRLRLRPLPGVASHSCRNSKTSAPIDITYIFQPGSAGILVHYETMAEPGWAFFRCMPRPERCLVP